MSYEIKKCTKVDEQYICDELVEYNLSKVPKTQDIKFEFVNRKIVDCDGKIIAGILAKMYCWNVVYVDILWVDKSYSNKGYGSALLAEVEKISREKGCHLIHLDTFDFQAKDFYIKQGYEVFGVLDDCPREHQRYYLKKLI